MRVRGVRILRVFKIEGIVLYPFILLAPKKPSLQLLNHERIHWDQIRKVGVLRFYSRYLLEYCQGRRRGLNHDQAYRNISFEKEAFDHQHDHQYEVS